MAKWYGQIGFAETRETDLDEWTEVIVERPYPGDILSNSRSMPSGSEINNDITISNKISFITDPYARENFHNIRYATFMGTRWRVTSIDVQYPRLNITLGGVWMDER